MSKDGFKLYEGDDLDSAIKIFSSLNLEGVLVYNDEEDIKGLVTLKNLIEGIASGKSKLRDIAIKIDVEIFEEDNINSVIDIKRKIYML